MDGERDREREREGGRGKILKIGRKLQACNKR